MNRIQGNGEASIERPEKVTQSLKNVVGIAKRFRGLSAEEGAQIMYDIRVLLGFWETGKHPFADKPAETLPKPKEPKGTGAKPS